MSIMSDKKKVLFVIKVSRKNRTGFHVMNNYVRHSALIKSMFSAKFIIMVSSNIRWMPLWLIHNCYLVFLNSINLLYYIWKEKPELVYFTISPVKVFIRDILYVLIIKFFNTKVLYHLHGKGIRKKSFSRSIFRILYEWAYKDVYVICLSEKLYYDVDFLPVKKLYAVPNAIPDYAGDNNRMTNNKDPYTINILFLSNLIKSKGIEDFVESIKIIANKNYSIKGLIVGLKMEYDSEMVSSIIGKYDKYIEYLGPKYGREKHEILEMSEILVFPTYYETETFGLVILEAMQFGLPVITTDEAAITDMIDDGENGFIVEKKNPEMIATKIELLLKNPVLIQTIGNMNREKYLKHYTIDKFENNICQVINEVIADT